MDQSKRLGLFFLWTEVSNLGNFSYAGWKLVAGVTLLMDSSSKWPGYFFMDRRKGLGLFFLWTALRAWIFLMNRSK